MKKNKWNVILMFKGREIPLARNVSINGAFTVRDSIWKNFVGSQVLIRNY